MNNVIEKAKSKTASAESLVTQVNGMLSKKIDDKTSYIDKASWKTEGKDLFNGHDKKAWSEGWDKGWSKWGK